MATTTFTVLPAHAIRRPPLLISFPSGLPAPSNTTFKANARDPRRPSRREIRAESERVTYEGRNFGGDIPSLHAGQQFLICLRNRRSGAVTAVESDGKMILPLNIATVSNVTGIAADESGALGNMDAYGRRDLLISAFGSRKKQRMDAAAKSNIVHIASVAAATAVAKDLKSAAAIATATTPIASTHHDVTSTVVGSTATSITGVAEMAARRRILPPFDCDVNAPELAYPIDGVMPSLLRNSTLSNCVATLLTAANTQLNSTIKHRDYDTESKVNESNVQSSSSGGEINEIALEEACRQMGIHISTFALDRVQQLMRQYACSSGNAVVDKTQTSRHVRHVPLDEKYSSILKRLEAAILLALYVSVARASKKLRITRNNTTATFTNDIETGQASNENIAIIQLPLIPAAIASHIIETFAEPQSSSDGVGGERIMYVRTPELQLRLLAHICVLALHVDNFEGDMGMLAADLLMPPKQLLLFYRNIGATAKLQRRGGVIATKVPAGEPGHTTSNAMDTEFTTTVLHLIVTLTTPLRFPTLKPPSLNKSRGH